MLILSGVCQRLVPLWQANQAAWPQSRSQKEGCEFLIMRLVGLFDLTTRVWADAAIAPFCSSERKLRKDLRTGDTIVVDGGFCCGFTLYLFGKKGMNVIVCNNGSRKPDPRAAKLGGGISWNAGGSLTLGRNGFRHRPIRPCRTASRCVWCRSRLIPVPVSGLRKFRSHARCWIRKR